MGSAIVAYTDPQGVFGKHEALVEENLQRLATLHWRPSATSLEFPEEGSTHGAGTTTRTIPHLKLQLIPEGTHKHKQHQILGLSNSPFVQILIFETVPLDLYRTKLRQIGKDWFQSKVEVRESTGYVVVHAVAPGESPKATKAVWSRITTDFDAANCIQLTPSARDSWVRLRSLVQEQLIDAFDSRINTLDVEVKKLRATQDVPGWNFGTLFAVYESLAWAYESMTLFDDSLRVYNGLESMVRGIPREKWPKDPFSVAETLTSNRDALIDPMLEQKASVFDINRHLLSRKISLYLSRAASKREQEKTVDSLADHFVLECITMTIGKVPILLESLIKSIGKRAAYSWLLVAIREVFSLTAEAASAKFVQGKGELTLIERDALQNLGESKGWRIPGLFNDISLDDGQESVGKEDDQKTDGEEKWDFEELKSETAFQTEFMRLTQLAIGYFRNAKLPRAVNRLTGQLVLINYNKGAIDEAWKILQKTPQLLELSPPQPAVAMLDIAMRCASELKLEGKVIELAWKIICLPQEVPSSLFEKAVNAAETLDSQKPLTHELSIWFIPKLRPYVRGDDLGYFVEIELVPKQSGHQFVSLKDAEISAYVSTDYGTNTKKVVFRTEDVKGPGILKLYTKTFVEGPLQFNRLEVHHKIHTFEHDLSEFSGVMKPLSGSFTAQITLAKNYTMKKRNINVQIQSPKEISQAKVHMHPVDQQLQLLWDKAEGMRDLVSFRSKTSSVPVLVDHEHPRSRLRVIVEYDGCTFEFLERLDFSLAVSVDFQEYFRQPPRILSQFMVKPFSNIPTVFLQASLDSSMNYEVSPFANDALKEPYIAYENAPVSYIFKIAKLEKPDRSKPRSIQLTLTYRSLLWECQEIFYKACLSSLEPKGLRCYSPLLGRITEQLCAKVDIVHYMTTGTVRLSDDSHIEHVVDTVLQHMNPTDISVISSSLHTLLKEGVLKDSTDSFESLNSTIALEVPDPDAEIVHYAQLETHIKGDNGKKVNGIEQYVVGSVIPATLQIETVSFLGSDISEREFEYELHRIADGWSYTGKVKGTFKGTQKVHETISLIPNRSGELLLPNVIIRPIHEQGSTSDTNSENSVSIMDPQETVVVTQHANNQVLVVPDLNMLAITF